METPLSKKLKAFADWLSDDESGPVIGRFFLACGVITIMAFALAIYYTQ